jgi:hypothetical protein
MRAERSAGPTKRERTCSQTEHREVVAEPSWPIRIAALRWGLTSRFSGTWTPLVWIYGSPCTFRGDTRPRASSHRSRGYFWSTSEPRPPAHCGSSSCHGGRPSCFCSHRLASPLARGQREQNDAARAVAGHVTGTPYKPLRATCQTQMLERRLAPDNCSGSGHVWPGSQPAPRADRRQRDGRGCGEALPAHLQHPGASVEAGHRWRPVAERRGCGGRSLGTNG